jgi:hypothetical protein
MLNTLEDFEIRCLILSIALALCVGPAQSAEIYRLTKGSYMPGGACAQLGGAASTYFDGRHLSFHYSFCKTTPINGDTYKQTCVEAQGEDLANMTMKKLEADPDKTTTEIKLRVISSKKFSFDGEVYSFCP